MKTVLLQRAPGSVKPLHWHAKLHLRAEGQPFRAPHHTVSEIGAIAELAIAAGGVLYIEDVDQWRVSTLQSIRRTWAMMNPVIRPVLIFTFRPSGTTISDVLARRLEALPAIDLHEVL